MDADQPMEVGVRVRVHPGVCEGWGLCNRFGGSDIYPLDAEGHVDVHLLEVPPEHAAAARLGASVCPVQAISLLAASGHATPGLREVSRG